MTTHPLLTEDQLIDMAFITSLLQMTDKWIYKLIKEPILPQTYQAKAKFPMAEERGGVLASGTCRPVP